MTKILITGSSGFIAHHVIEHILNNTDWDIIGIDRLSYASSGYQRLRENGAYDNPRCRFFTCDFRNPVSSGLASEIGNIDYIIHMGAETHVDRSIDHPMDFVQANVVGTCHLLNYAKTTNPKLFIFFSTDEVFGPAPEGTEYKEWDRYNSGNPYAASKAGAEELVLAYGNTYGLPIMITHTMNVIGERQHPEKFVPLCIRKIMNGEEITIHADRSRKKAGSRFYIHARNVASALLFLINKGTQGDKFNIVGEVEISNDNLALFIGKALNKTVSYKLVDFHSTRPGHDLRYALCGDKMKSLGWNSPIDFYNSLEKTILWTLKHPKWLKI